MSDQIQASHILVSYDQAQNSTSQLIKEDALEHIENLKSRLQTGSEFSEVAREYSDCPSAEKGGDLGVFGRGAMVPAFDAAAFDLEIGEVSDVVESEFGYHLIYRTN